MKRGKQLGRCPWTLRITKQHSGKNDLWALASLLVPFLLFCVLRVLHVSNKYKVKTKERIL